MEAKEPNWLPIESNPTSINEYLESLGVVPGTWTCHDVLTLEDWALTSIPRPVIAVVFLYPLKKSAKELEKAESEKIKSEGQPDTSSVFFLKQKIRNACGTVGIIHALANNMDKILLEESSVLQNFYLKALDLNPEQRGDLLVNDQDFEARHKKTVTKGSSKVPDASERVNTHFVTYVDVQGKLFELDGRKEFPIYKGESSGDLLFDAVPLLKAIMERDPTEIRFTVLALAPAFSD